MPKFFEVFCVKNNVDEIKRSLCKGYCPLSDSECDGGGNRHQTKLQSADIKAVTQLGIHSVGSTIPAVCSVDYGCDAWIVCPRRLFSFPKNSSTVKSWLNKHESDVLLSAGFHQGDTVAIFSEVYLKYSDDDTDINYHFDYIVFPVSNEAVLLSKFMSDNGIMDKIEIKKAKSMFMNAKMASMKGKECWLTIVPDFSRFSILEVMTASTSGSNSSKGTDIKSAYIKLLSGLDYDCPGINKRQVWGRMATQLFAKTEIAEEWGGKTFWIVQDKLLENIEKTTKLRLSNEGVGLDGAVNFISLFYNSENEMDVEVKTTHTIPSGLNGKKTGVCTDILLPKLVPDKIDFIKAIIRSQVTGIVKI